MDVKTLCLGVLTLGEHTGYEIKKHFEGAFAHFFVAGFGSIYPALADLTRAGLVEGRDVAQERRPDKKVYRLTEAGREALQRALLETPPRHKIRSEFLVLLYFVHLLPRERVEEILDQRQREIEQMLDDIRCACDSTDPRSGLALVAGFGRVTLEAQLAYLRAHRGRALEAAGRAGSAGTSPLPVTLRESRP